MKIYSEFLRGYLSPLTKAEKRRVRQAAQHMAREGRILAHANPRGFSPVYPSGPGFKYTIKAYYPAEADEAGGYQAAAPDLRYVKCWEFITVDELYCRAPGADIFAAAKAGEVYREE